MQFDFDGDDLAAYREFADAVSWHITKIERSAKYVTDIPKLRTQLNDVYQRVMLEEKAPDAAPVLRCLIEGALLYRSKGLSVEVVRKVVMLLKSTLDERAKIIVANLHTRLDAVPRYPVIPVEPITDDDIPF